MFGTSYPLNETNLTYENFHLSYTHSCASAYKIFLDICKKQFHTSWQQMLLRMGATMESTSQPYSLVCLVQLIFSWVYVAISCYQVLMISTCPMNVLYHSQFLCHVFNSVALREELSKHEHHKFYYLKHQVCNNF